MEIKLTAEMFEVSSFGPNSVGMAWDEMKIKSNSVLCSVEPIPFEGRVYIPLQSGYRFCFAEFDENQKCLGTSTYYNWRYEPQMCMLDPRTRYIGLCIGNVSNVNDYAKIIGGGYSL